MECKQCKHRISTVDVANIAVAHWRETILKDDCENRHAISLPLLPERLDIAAYTYSYHVDGGCYRENDPFWGNKDVRTMLMRLRFDEHAASHRKSCFKKVNQYVVVPFFVLTCTLC